jgi:hypothetical protein
VEHGERNLDRLDGSGANARLVGTRVLLQVKNYVECVASPPKHQVAGCDPPS